MKEEGIDTIYIISTVEEEDGTHLIWNSTGNIYGIYGSICAIKDEIKQSFMINEDIDV